MKEYRIIQAYSFDQLEKMNQAAMKDGWEPTVGGLIIQQTRGEAVYLREMVRESVENGDSIPPCDRAGCENTPESNSAMYGHVCEDCVREITRKNIGTGKAIEEFFASPKTELPEATAPDYEEVCGAAMPGVEVVESVTYKPVDDISLLSRFPSVKAEMELVVGEVPRLVFTGDPIEIAELIKLMDAKGTLP